MLICGIEILVLYAQLEAWTNSITTWRHQGSAPRSLLYCDSAQSSHNAQKSKQTCLLAVEKHATLYFGLNLRKTEVAIFLGSIFAAR